MRLPRLTPAYFMAHAIEAKRIAGERVVWAGEATSDGRANYWIASAGFWYNCALEQYNHAQHMLSVARTGKGSL